jgi:DNA-binding CsgD family transcriptional regulator
MTQAELIGLLSTTGATSQEIAGVLNITANAVSVAVHRLKKINKEI